MNRKKRILNLEKRAEEAERKFAESERKIAESECNIDKAVDIIYSLQRVLYDVGITNGISPSKRIKGGGDRIISTYGVRTNIIEEINIIYKQLGIERKETPEASEVSDKKEPGESKATATILTGTGGTDNVIYSKQAMQEIVDNINARIANGETIPFSNEVLGDKEAEGKILAVRLIDDCNAGRIEMDMSLKKRNVSK